MTSNATTQSGGFSDITRLDDERVSAIEASGWGGEFRLFQPRNLAFWVLAAAVIWGMFLWINGLVKEAAYYAPALGVAIGVFFVYGAAFWWFTQVIDRYSSQPAKIRVTAFMWGGFAATWVMASVANDSLRQIYAKLFGQAWALKWGASSAVWFTEEWGKGIGLLLLIALAPHLVRTAFDGFVLGAFIGLGFQIIEDIAYIGEAAGRNFGVDQLGASLQTFVMRLSTGVAGHILFTAIFCTGLVYVLGRPEEPRRLGRGIGLMVLAMAIHFYWDAPTAVLGLLVGGNETAVGILGGISLFMLPLVALFVVVKIFKMVVVNERAFVVPMLAPEVARGVITEAELDAAAGDRKARKHYRTLGGGRHRRRNVLEATFDLAHELGRSGGASDAGVEFARSEVRRLREKVETS